MSGVRNEVHSERMPVISHTEREGSCFIPKRGLRRWSFENEGAVINLNRKSMINLYMISFPNDDHIFHIPTMVIERADLKEKVI